MNKRRGISIVAAIVIILLVKWQNAKKDIQAEDACLCTEVLSNEILLSRETPLELVEDCKKLFTNFEKAHGNCIQSLPEAHPEVVIDSLKNT
jgi:hypothetical protein